MVNGINSHRELTTKSSDRKEFETLIGHEEKNSSDDDSSLEDILSQPTKSRSNSIRGTSSTEDLNSFSNSPWHEKIDEMDINIDHQTERQLIADNMAM